jgi:hypothetical protein
MIHSIPIPNETASCNSTVRCRSWSRSSDTSALHGAAPRRRVSGTALLRGRTKSWGEDCSCPRRPPSQPALGLGRRRRSRSVGGGARTLANPPSPSRARRGHPRHADALPPTGPPTRASRHAAGPGSARCTPSRGPLRGSPPSPPFVLIGHAASFTPY